MLGMINKLVKIGGAIVNSRDNFLKIVELIKSDDFNYSFFVISGFGKTTQKLRSIAETALISLESSLAQLEMLISELSYLSNKNCDLDADINQLKRMINGINITKELTPKLMDRILSYGEILSMKLIQANIESQDIKFVDSDKLIVTDSNFNNANPIFDLSREKTIDYLLKNQFSKYVTQGFMAADANGNRTTMGMESSNLTATLIADILKLKQVTIITDVNGIRNIDPKLSKNTKLIENINYRDAIILANYGLKQFYAKMIEIASKDNIEIMYRSLDNKEEITTINNDKSDNSKTLIVKKLSESQEDYDILYHDNNFYIQFKQNEYDNENSITQYILYNVDPKDTINYLISNFDFDKIWIDNYGSKVVKIISKSRSEEDLIKLINYVNL